MDFTKLFKKDKQYNYFIVALLIIYIIFNVQTPDLLAHYIDTLVGKIAVVLLGLSVFMHADKLVGILTLVAAYELYERSHKTHVRGTERKLPKDKRMPELTAEHQFPVTLEEQVVKKMAPWVLHPSKNAASYKPVMESDLNASDL